ncbi:MAG TPA: preprotein translocase subunit SecG [Verrucomicrobiae bacterium]
MSLLIGFLTFILVVNCLFLVLLVLVQLPKKEAGAGLAFGAGAVDTLIGAGSGNALTKMTKYTAGIFLGMALLLSFLNAQRHEGASRGLQEELSRKSSAVPMLQTPPSAAPNTGLLNTNPAGNPAPAAATNNAQPVLDLKSTAPANKAPAVQNNTPPAQQPQ